jgi:transcriptional regulator with XRE-family HTH domain
MSEAVYLAELSEKIGRRRKLMGMTQQELADKVMVKRNMIAMIETMKTRPGLYTAVLLAKALKIDLVNP